MMTLAALLTTGCDHDPDPEPSKQPESLLHGEWLEYANTPSSKGYSAVTFNDDGTFVQDMELVLKNNKSSYEKLRGEMFEEEGKFTLQYNNHSGSRQVDEYEITKLTPTRLETWLPAISASDAFIRLKATENVTVGESLRIPVLNESGKTTDYLSTNPAVATVDSRGEIKAVKRGRAFIIAQAGDASVAARIEVTDPDNYIDDYTVWIDKKLSDFDKVYDTYYYTTKDNSGNPMRSYFVFDQQVRGILVTYLSGEVKVIETHFEGWVDMDKIDKFFASKYTYDYTNNLVKWYKTTRNGKQLAIGISKDVRAISVFATYE